MSFPLLTAILIGVAQLPAPGDVHLLAQESTSQITTAFTGAAPRFVEARTTFNSVYSSFAKYYFTVYLPAELQQPLAKISIQQQPNLDFVEYRLDETAAFQGTFEQQGEPLSLSSVSLSPDQHTVTVTFDPPVPPGTTVSVRLKPKENPRYSGIYLFRLTTFPAGPNPIGLSPGVGRIHIYQRY